MTALSRVTLPVANGALVPTGAALRRWASLGAIQRRVAASLAAEVQRASDDVAAETATVTRIFQELATKAAAQSKRVAHLAALASTVEVDGERIALDDLAGMFEGTLGDIVAKILQLSKHAMATVYALDSVSTSMQEVERCISGVDRVNRQTRLLAMNARIEAARAGVAGLAFGVISDEVRTLSGGTEKLSDAMRTHVGAVLGGLRNSHAALRTVATLDMSENIMAKDKLDHLVGVLVGRSTLLGEIAQQAAADAEDIARQVGLAITSLQFQDRVSQRLGQVTDTLSILGDAVASLQADTAEVTPEAEPDEAAAEAEWLRQLAGRYRLSEMRAAFVNQVLEGQEAPAPDPDTADSGSIELF